MMVDENGIIKVIDTEVYTGFELKLQQSILDCIDGSQKQKPKSFKYADRILYWIDGRPSVEDSIS